MLCRYATSDPDDRCGLELSAESQVSRASSCSVSLTLVLLFAHPNKDDFSLVYSAIKRLDEAD